MALVGRHVLLEYAVGGPRLWHERLALEHIDGDNYVVCTPDEDVYSEELGVLNQDVRSIRVMAAPGAYPPDIGAARVYPLPAFAANVMVRLRAEAQRVADQERQALAAGAAPAVPAAAAVAVAPGVPLAAPAHHPAGVLKWLAAETTDTVAYGQEIAGVVAPLARDSKLVHMHGGQAIFLMCVDGADLESFRQRPAKSDDRVLRLS
eukprot:Skav221972  [mRNA]  locus=scaffold195:903653:904270:- [translate_table: standard]